MTPKEGETKPKPEEDAQNKKNFLLFACDEDIALEQKAEKMRLLYRDFF
jgi:hypothetical protein